jgi:Holliday junction resolvase RusA-like endonuclease
MIIFYCKIQISRHSSKKNEKRPMFNKGSNRFFIGKTSKAKYVENELIHRLQIEKLKTRIDLPITCDINAKLTFYFPESVYFTKKGDRSKKLPDLSNLYELPQDCLQKVGIIQNDTQIVSHDGSRRKPLSGNNYVLEIELSHVEEEVVVRDK